MSGFLVFMSFVIMAASSMGYHSPLPGIYAVGQELVITSERGCGGFWDVEPLEDIAHEVRQITPWQTGITFQAGGIVTGLKIICGHSIYDDEIQPDEIEVDWMIR